MMYSTHFCYFSGIVDIYSYNLLRLLRNIFEKVININCLIILQCWAMYWMIGGFSPSMGWELFPSPLLSDWF
jgi:hypothetical protein